MRTRTRHGPRRVGTRLIPVPVSNQKRTTATPRSNRPLLSAPIFKSRLRAAHLWDLGSGEGPRFLEGRGGALVATWCPPGIRLAAGWLATGRGCDYASKVGVYLNLKFWCVGGAAVVVPWLVRGIPAVQSGCGSGGVGFGPSAFRTKI